MPSLHLHSMVVDKVGEPAGKTTQTDTSSNAQSRQVAGAAERKARAQSPSPKTAYPSAFSHERPLSRMNQTFGPNRTDPSNGIFMPRTAGCTSDPGPCPAFVLAASADSAACAVPPQCAVLPQKIAKA